MSAMSTVAEFPELIKDIFVVDEPNQAGIYAIRFYIRGKKWTVAIDDEFLFQFPTANPHYFVFAQPDDDRSVLWAPILEKAWAKVKGDYDAADGGFVVSGLSSLTGSPAFHYSLRVNADNGNAEQF